MGHDKAFLSIGKQTLIELVIQRLRPSVDRLMVIGNVHNIHRLRELRLDAALMDLKPAYGPLMGIYTGLMHTETPLNVFVSCDMPWVEGRLIKRLVKACGEGVEVVASLQPQEGLQPFPLICHVSACRTIGALLDRGERSLHRLCVQPHARLVRIEGPELWRSFTNVNTPADYAQLCHGLLTRPASAGIMVSPSTSSGSRATSRDE